VPCSTICSCRTKTEPRAAHGYGAIFEPTELKEKGFSKSERIVSQKLIDELFTSGQSHSLTAFPLRAVYAMHAMAPQGKTHTPVQLLLSVPKRRFKHAVDRNRVKRQLREAFRKNKSMLAANVPEGQSVAMAFIWQSDKHFPSDDVDHRVVSLLQRIAKQLNPQKP